MKTYKFQLEKINKQHNTWAKISTQQIPQTKNQQTMSSMEKINLTKWKINVQRSGRDKFYEQKSTSNKFQKQNQFFKEKINA